LCCHFPKKRREKSGGAYVGGGNCTNTRFFVFFNVLKIFLFYRKNIEFLIIKRGHTRFKIPNKLKNNNKNLEGGLTIRLTIATIKPTKTQISPNHKGKNTKIKLIVII